MGVAPGDGTSSPLATTAATMPHAGAASADPTAADPTSADSTSADSTSGEPTTANPAGPRRTTSQRTALLQVLAGTEEFVTAQDLHTALRDSGTSIGLATVYRTLADLVTTGEVDTVRNPAGETLYRQCGADAHHHHLVCRMCGRTEEVTNPGVERWARAVAEEYGFVDLGHEVELFGVCGDCAAARTASQHPSPAEPAAGGRATGGRATG